MEKKLVKIGEAARILGTCVNTLRRWEASGDTSPREKRKVEHVTIVLPN
jgi:putative resolvase